MKKLYLALFLIAAYSLTVTLLSGQAAALADDPGGDAYISNQTPIANSAKWNPPATYYPDDNSAENSSSTNIGGNVTPYYVVGNNTGEYSFSVAQIKIFVKLGQSLSITVINAGPACHSEQSAGLVGPDYSTSGGSGPNTFFQLVKDESAVVSPGAQPRSAQLAGHSDSCDKVINFRLLSVTKDDCSMFAPDKRPENFDGYCVLQAQVSDPSIKGENSFRVVTDSGSYVGMAGTLTGYGYRDSDLNAPANTWTNQVVFSADQTCSNTANGTKPASFQAAIIVGDMDASKAYWNPNIEVEIQQERRGEVNQWKTRVLRDTDWLRAQGNGTIIALGTTFSSDYRYRVLLKNVGVRNTIFVQLAGSGEETLSQMAARYKLDAADCTRPALASCTATPVSANLKLNQSAAMSVKLTNDSASGGPTYSNKYQVRQIDPAGQAKNISGSLAPGQSQTLPQFSISARGSPQTVDFKYALFDEAGNKVDPNASGYLCHAKITWSKDPPKPGAGGGGSFIADCNQVTVSNVTSTATYQKPVTAYRSNIKTASIINGPLAVVVDPDGNPIDPGGGGGAGPRTTTEKITKVPVAIKITNVNNSNETYTYVVPDGVSNGGSKTFSTFDMWGDMWPHTDYTLELFIEGTRPNETSNTYPNDGSWGPNGTSGPTYWYSIEGFGEQTVANCMSVACGTYTTVDAEPGQTKQFSYGIRVTNLTGRTYSANDGNGYRFGVNAYGGLRNVNYQGPSSNITARGQPVNINVNFTARSDFSGSFGITMYFKNGVLSLDSFSGNCGDTRACESFCVTPATRPFFEVRAGDIAAGGGFRTAAGSCGSSSDPPYITPLGSGDDNRGGIRAFANKNAGRGSLSEFGVDALGLIWGNANGPYGFYSAHGNTFANTNVPAAGMGGYLNSNSQSHCVIDYYNNTRTTAAAAGFSGGSVPSASGQYQANNNVVISASSIPAGSHVTIYVDGDVEINGNITYARTWDANDPNNAPFFTIIARGNIVLEPGVTQLDGLYIAQPRGASKGVFATCDSDNSRFCSSQLVVNGAVIAQQISLLRVHGTLGPLDADVNGIGQTPAEVFNFVPSMIIGIPNFSPISGGAVVPSSLETLFNLPPVF